MIKYELLIILHKLRWYYKKHYEAITWTGIATVAVALTITLRSWL